jgi:outer membrane protein
MKKYFFISCMLLLQQTVQAQKIWSLKECVDYALANNISIKQSEISMQISEVNQTQSFYNLFPTLNGNGSYSYNRGRSIDPTSNLFTTSNIQSGNLSLNTGITLFNGLQLQRQLQQSKLNYMSSKYDLDKIKDDVSLNVAASYLQVLYSNEQLKASNDRLDALNKQKDRTILLTDAGTLPAGSLLDAEAQVANEEYTKVTAENALVSAYLSLTQLLNLDSIGDFRTEGPKVEIPDEAILSVGVSEIYTTSLQTKPEIKSADYKVLSSEKEVSISKGSHWPRLSLFGSLSTSYSDQSQDLNGAPVFGGYSPSNSITSGGDTVLVPNYQYSFVKTRFGDQLDNNFYRSVGLSINIPIFNGLSTRSSVNRAKLNYESAKYSAELIRNELYKSIQQAHADAVAAFNKYNASQKSVDALTQSYGYMDKKFNAGLITSLDFLTARNNLTQAESNLLQAKYDFIFRLKVLDFYQGKPLEY